MQIFVSFSGEDSDSAERVAQALRQGGHDVICTAEGGREGAAHHVKLREELNASDLLVFLASEHSLEDGCFTLTELGWAKTKWRNPDSHVLVVMLDGVDRSKLPAYVSGVGHLEPEGNLEAEVATAAERMLSSQTTYKSAIAMSAWKRRLLMLLCVGIGFVGGYFVGAHESGPRTSGALPEVGMSGPFGDAEVMKPDGGQLALNERTAKLAMGFALELRKLSGDEGGKREIKIFQTAPLEEALSGFRLVAELVHPDRDLIGMKMCVTGGVTLQPLLPTYSDDEGRGFTASIPVAKAEQQVLVIVCMWKKSGASKLESKDFKWEYEWDPSE